MIASKVFRQGVVAIPLALVSLSLVSMTTGGRDKAVRAEFAKDGKSIVVVNAGSGAVLHRLPKPAGVVRSVFALAGGSVVVTTFPQNPCTVSRIRVSSVATRT